MITSDLGTYAYNLFVPFIRIIIGYIYIFFRCYVGKRRLQEAMKAVSEEFDFDPIGIWILIQDVSIKSRHLI